MPEDLFDTVLVANRGEIAVRVIRTLHALDIRAVAVASDADVDAVHVRAADEVVRIGPTPASESYLSIERLVAAARRCGAQAVHPGYGFLSENAAFARACAEAGLVFIGPPPAAMEAMGDKIRAKATAQAAGVPVIAGVAEPGLDDAGLVAAAADVGFPLMVKAAAGGGGKGMRIVRDPPALPEALAAARREARAAFGDDALLLERYVERPRHIEIQVLADAAGGVVHLGERECSLQRRHQKVVEEAPSPALDTATRTRMGAAAVAVARACGYVGAGTVEMIAPGDDPSAFAFLEMNTRLQVEHPVTEAVYGIDLVEEQVRIPAGQPLRLRQDDIAPRGHAIEARVYAEDPARGFLPTGGRLLAVDHGGGDGVRVGTGIAAGTVVGSAYDPLLAKVIASGPDRATALQRLDRALAETAILGVTANVAFLRALLADPEVRAGRLDTGLIERRLDDLVGGDVPADVLVAAALAGALALERRNPFADPFDVPGGWRLGEPAWARWRLQPLGADPVEVAVRGRAADAEVRVGERAPCRASAAWAAEDAATLVVDADGVVRRYRHARADGVTWLARDGMAWALRETERLAAERREEAGGGELSAPMPGTVAVVSVREGDAVRAGQALLVVEAMKMEHPITAPIDGVVAALHVRSGEQVAMDQPLVVVAPAEEDG